MNNVAMNRYIGVKLINAKPMTREEYNELHGWTVPADENPDDPGYLVEYVDGGQANHPDFAGYISWSPKDVFERAYRPTQGMTFGLALEALKNGFKVARAGWNGKGMWLSMSGKGVREVPAGSFWFPSITMKTATGEILMGWLARQTDMFAEDWLVIP